MAVAVGYTIGARAGRDGLEELIASFKSIQKSDEFGAALKALRSHAGYALREIAELVVETETPAPGNLLERVRSIAM